jgi:hypothetical protein
VNGHNLFEVVSALQKSVRRGLVDDSLYWAVDMDLSGYSEYCWRRLMIMAAEDVGLGSRDTVTRIAALRVLYKELQGTSPKYAPERLMFVQAVMELAVANKSRTVDNALMVHYSDHDRMFRDIPDYAYDYHTQVGRSKGRKPGTAAGAEHFVAEGAKLAPVGDAVHPMIDTRPDGTKPAQASVGVADPYVARWLELEEEGIHDRIPPL